MPKGESSAGARLWKPAQRGKGGITYDIQIQKRGKDGNISRVGVNSLLSSRSSWLRQFNLGGKAPRSPSRALPSHSFRNYKIIPIRLSQEASKKCREPHD